MTDASETVPAQSAADAQAGGARRTRDLGQAIGVGVRSMRGAVRAGHGGGARPAFDTYHRPDPALVDDCVHCGFCLSTCPTYVLWGEEMDSPRGRIYLIREGLEGEALGGTMVRHFDQCLGCLACVTACPSGVQYDKLIEATRGQIQRRYGRSFSDAFFRELIYLMFPHPERLRLMLPALWLWQRTGLQRLVGGSGVLDLLPARARALVELAPPVPFRAVDPPERTGPSGTERRRVGILLGCVQRAFFSHVNRATAQVLAAEGCSVVAPSKQGCCGALSLHVGREAEARRLARRTIDTFEVSGVDSVVVNVAGCGSAMKEYGHLLRDDPAYAERARDFSARVRDVSELLIEMGPRATYHPLPMSAVYHDACHLAHGQRITRQPRDLLRPIPGLELREVPREREICCGSAGTYNLLEPEAARDLGERKARNVAAAGADLLVTANPGCDLQIRAALARQGVSMPAVHLVEVLDASIRGTGPESLLR